MSNSPLFKRAFVRGLNEQLIREGVVVYPSKEAADASADYIADQSGMPDPYENGEALDVKVASYLCENLIKAAEFQCKQAGNKYSPVVTKTAQENTPVAAAMQDAWALMEKAAAETGSLVTGGTQTNDMPAAASDNAEAALEQSQRPENYANLGEKGVGNYERKGEGAVGTEQTAPNAPKATDSGSNSVTENSKSASFANIVRRVAQKSAADTGTLVTGGTQTNDLPAAAQNNAEAALEMSNRPENYANMGERGVGQTDMQIPSGAVVGQEMPHPEAPAATDAGSNSIIDQTKNAFDQLFSRTAEQVVPYLPEKMADNQKVAHVRAMMGLETPERAAYLGNLYNTLGAKKEASEAVRAHFLKKAEEECGSETPMAEKKEEKKDEKGPELPAFLQKKTEEDKTASAGNSLSSLRSRLKNLNG